MLGCSPAEPNSSLTTETKVNKNKLFIRRLLTIDAKDERKVVNDFYEGSDNRWGYFPSFSFAWKIDKEDFMKNIDFVSSAKLRAGWGLTGNNRVGDYDSQSQLAVSYNSGYVWGDGERYAPGANQNNLGVPDLRWEKTSQTNIGLDLGFVNRRIYTTLDYYKKRTSDLLLRAEMALHTGFNRVQQNVGEVENAGIELSINTRNISTDDFKWNSSFNISFNKNKVISLNHNQEAIFTDPGWIGGVTEHQYITRVGEPVGMMYGLEFDGIYQWEDFIWDNEHQTNTLKEGIPDNGLLPIAPGSLRYIDQNKDGTINALDRVIIGNPHPKHFGGFSNTIEYKGFDATALLQWSYGSDILNANKARFESTGGGRNGFAGLADKWTPINIDGKISAVKYLSVYGGAPSGNKIDNRYIEDGSYMKLKSVSIGYSLSKSVLEKIKLKRFRIHVTGENLYTWTKYSGYDPDVSVGRYGALTPRLDYSAYPRSTTVMFGLDITF